VEPGTEGRERAGGGEERREKLAGKGRWKEREKAAALTWEKRG